MCRDLLYEVLERWKDPSTGQDLSVFQKRDPATGRSSWPVPLWEQELQRLQNPMRNIFDPEYCFRFFGDIAQDHYLTCRHIRRIWKKESEDPSVFDISAEYGEFHLVYV